MFRKISLSVMIFTYLFAGLAHFTHFAYFLSLAPPFFPKPGFLVLMSGTLQVLFAFFLALGLTRRWACYAILFFWSLSLPIDIYLVYRGGAGIPLSQGQLAGLVPFHLLLMAWAFWQSLGPKSARPPAPSRP